MNLAIFSIGFQIKGKQHGHDFLGDTLTFNLFFVSRVIFNISYNYFNSFKNKPQPQKSTTTTSFLKYNHKRNVHYTHCMIAIIVISKMIERSHNLRDKLLENGREKI